MTTLIFLSQLTRKYPSVQCKGWSTLEIWFLSPRALEYKIVISMNKYTKLLRCKDSGIIIIYMIKASYVDNIFVVLKWCFWIWGGGRGPWTQTAYFFSASNLCHCSDLGKIKYMSYFDWSFMEEIHVKSKR